MKAGIAKEAKYKRTGGAGYQCLQCRRVIKDGQATLSQTRQSYSSYGSYSANSTDYWHRACIEGLLKKTAAAAKDAVEVATPEGLADKFEALRASIAAGESRLVG